MKKFNEQNAFKYTGYSSMKKIEERLLEIEREKPMRIYHARENYSGSMEDEIEADDIKYLGVEKTQLQLKRQFILDRRNGWKAKGIWDIALPIVASVITAYLVLWL